MAAKQTENDFVQRLAEDGITLTSVRDRIAQALAEPRQIAADRSLLVRPEGSALVSLLQPERRWQPDIERTSAELRRYLRERILRNTLTYSLDARVTLAEGVDRMAHATAELASALDRKIEDARRKFARYEGRLEKWRDRHGRADSGGVVQRVFGFSGGLLGVADQFADRVRAARDWDSREVWAQRLDMQIAHRAAWQDVRDALTSLPEALTKLQMDLFIDAEEATFSSNRSAVADSLTTRSITWEVAGTLADLITDREPDPMVPVDLLLVLTGKESSALGVLDAAAEEVADRQAAAFRIAALDDVTDGAIREAGREMLRALRAGAAKDAHLFQIAERDPEDHQVPEIWPAVPQQAGIVAVPGPAPVIGFLRIDRPIEIAAVQGDALNVIPDANPFVNPELAGQFTTVASHVEEEVAG